MLIRRSALIVSLISASLALAADWPQWRGPNRDGVSPETGLLDTWPSGGPRLVWKTQGLGEGYSSFAVVGKRLFTQGQEGNEEFVLAFDVETGKQLWKTPTGSSAANDKGNGPRGAPTVDGNRLYAVAADGTLVCLTIETGKRIWGLNFVEKFGGRLPRWLYAESPLVDGDLLIVTPGGQNASVVALNKSTGEPVWKSQSDPAAYSSAVAFDAGGSRKVAVFTAKAAMGLDMKNGELQWRYEKANNKVANIATPIVHDGYVFVSSAYNTGAALLKLTPSGGNVSASEVYFNKEVQNHYCSSVLVGDYLYGYSGSILMAVKFMTGEIAWRDRSVGKGSVIFADGNLYCMGEGGVVGLVQPTPVGYKEKSRFQIQKGSLPTWTVPAIANGKLYLRDQDTLYCYDIKR
jgi:outer membrane protein assembly factor BamB